MCGRFALTANQLDIQRQFGADPHPSFEPLTPRYNTAPSQAVAVVGAKAGGKGRGLVRLKWGLVPNWGNGPTTRDPTNARSETVDRLPTFRECFRERRCILPMTGFYEWRTVGERKVPYFFSLPDDEVMAVAGIWDVWKGDGQRLVTCCLLTTSANETVKPLHERMPVVLPPETWDTWLAADTRVATLLPLLRPYPGPMFARPANPLVNNVRNDGPECLQPPPAVAA